MARARHLRHRHEGGAKYLPVQQTLRRGCRANATCTVSLRKLCMLIALDLYHMKATMRSCAHLVLHEAVLHGSRLKS